MDVPEHFLKLPFNFWDLIFEEPLQAFKFCIDEEYLLWKIKYKEYVHHNFKVTKFKKS